VSFAADERAGLCALLEEAGPDAPTLCDGWQARDLAAHLVLRERRLDAVAGIPGGPLAGHARRVQQALASRTPFPRLVELIRAGPPAWSPFRLPGLGDLANLLEFFTHHEDLRRAVPGWQPRELSPDLADALWQRLRVARLLLRRVPVGVELVRDDLAGPPGTRPVRMTARAATPMVTVTGHPAELTMWVMGRTGAARVRLDGSELGVRELAGARWRV
jgi:uncharacterized protein (TIGR03085 family)